MSTWLVLGSLIFLYFTQRQMTTAFARLVHRLGGNQKTLIILWSIIFLPGTVIHEISHFLLAAATGARTGKIEIFPEFLEQALDDEDKSRGVRLGSVQVSRLNPIQGFLVGMAPFFSGLALLVWLASLLQSDFQEKNYLTLIIETYFFFVIANSFFPSWTDIKQTLPLVVITLIVGLLLWFLGVQFNVSQDSPVWGLIDSLGNALLISVVINIFILSTLLLLNKTISRR
jgi:hypothetical protein